MTTLEALLVGLAGLVFFLRVLATPTPPATRLLLGAAQGACLVLHLGLDGARWQMGPAYVLTAGVWAPTFLGRFRFRQKPLRWMGRTVSIFGGAWLVGSGLLPAAFPVARWPKPTGSSPIGTRYLLLTDTSRTEPFEPGRSSFGESTAQAWYPAEDDCGDRSEHYWRDAAARSVAWTKANDLDWLPFLWSHLGRIPIHACLDAPISSRSPTYPVLVFSHGYWQIGGFNTALMEELASHGYVVLNIAHAFETPFAIYPDGRIRVFSRNNAEFQRRVDEERNPSLSSVRREIQEATKWEAQQPLYERWYSGEPAWQESNRIWVEDILFSISELPRLNGSVFRDRLDLARIGVVGFSFGGNASGLAAMADDRIKAGVNIDGFQYGHTAERNLAVPFMFLASEGHEGANALFIERAEDVVYDVTVVGTRHSNFSDMSMLAGIPGRLTGRLGSIGGRRGGITILRRYVVAFFDKHLRGVDSGFLDAPSPTYPEVRFQLRDPTR